MKPSYGVVSRYGLIDAAMSLDTIGILAKDVEDCKLIFDIIKGKDENNATSRDFIDGKESGKLIVGVLNAGARKEIWDLINSKIEDVCKKQNWKKENIKINHIDLGIQTYYPINYVEVFSGTRKFDGRKYGLKIEDSCGEEVLRRILGGSEISKAEHAGRYYWRALNAKKLIKKEFEKAFDKCDVLIMPTVPRIPHKFGEKISLEDMYNYDTLTVLANIAEIPGISVPCGEIKEGRDSIPVGIQILATVGMDDFLLEVAKKFE